MEQKITQVQIEIEQLDGFARCDIPMFGPVYGVDINDVVSAIECLNESGQLCKAFNLTISNDSNMPTPIS